MQSAQKQVIEAFQRVQEFIGQHPVPPPATYDGPKAMLDRVVDRLTAHTSDQARAGRLTGAETRRIRAQMRDLRRMHLKPIAQIAKATLKDQPGIDVALRLPAATIPLTRLVADALAIREAAAQYDPVFVANGRPADFLQRLDDAIARLTQSSLGRARMLGTKVGARAGIAQELQRGRKAVTLLDAIVTTSFADDREVLAKWRLAKRVQAMPGGGAPPGTGGTADENLPLSPPAAA